MSATGMPVDGRCMAGARPHVPEQVRERRSCAIAPATSRGSLRGDIAGRTIPMTAVRDMMTSWRNIFPSNEQ